MSVQRAAQLVEAGLWLQMSGDVDGAKRLFEQALKLDPSNARAQQLLEGAAPNAGFSVPPEMAVVPPPPLSVEPRSNPAGIDWRTAMGLSDGARAGAANATHSSDVPPGMKPRAEDADPRWEALAEPMPGAHPDAEPSVADDVLPLPGPSVPTPAQEGSGTPVVRAVTFTQDATSAWDSQSNPGVHLDDVKPGVGDAMDMVDTPAPHDPEAAETGRIREEVRTLLQGAKDLLDLDDHSGAMELILKAQQLSPNDPEVQSLRERSEKTLEAMYESKLGEMTGRPRVVLKDDEIIWLNLDHRAGFVLAQIDGNVTFEDLFEVCGMTRLDTARILAQLVDEGVIEK